MKNKRMEKMLLAICVLVGAVFLMGCGAVSGSDSSAEVVPIHGVVLDGRGHANMADRKSVV